MIAVLSLKLPWLSMPRQLHDQKKSIIHQHTLQQTLELSHLIRTESAQLAVQHRGGPLNELRINRLTLVGKCESRNAAILETAYAPDQALALQPIKHSRHRTWVVRHAPAKIRRRIASAGEVH